MEINELSAVTSSSQGVDNFKSHRCGIIGQKNYITCTVGPDFDSPFCTFFRLYFLPAASKAFITSKHCIIVYCSSPFQW